MTRFLLAMGIGVAVLVFLGAATLITTPERHLPSGYFPPGSLRADPATDEMYADWYTSLLRGMRTPNPSREPAQPSIYQSSMHASKHRDEYRALISKDHEYLMAIRVFTGEEGPEVVANEIDLRTNGQTRSVQRRLGGTQWGDIIHNIPQSRILSGHKRPAQFRGDCEDWVIEAREGSQYGIASESCPTNPEFLTLAQAFLNTVGWQPY